ncbi:unnamed protein product, partial [Prorocentrum cordatum]
MLVELVVRRRPSRKLRVAVVRVVVSVFRIFFARRSTALAPDAKPTPAAAAVGSAAAPLALGLRSATETAPAQDARAGDGLGQGAETRLPQGVAGSLPELFNPVGLGARAGAGPDAGATRSATYETMIFVRCVHAIDYFIPRNHFAFDSRQLVGGRCLRRAAQPPRPAPLSIRLDLKEYVAEFLLSFNMLLPVLLRGPLSRFLRMMSCSTASRASLGLVRALKVDSIWPLARNGNEGFNPWLAPTLALEIPGAPLLDQIFDPCDLLLAVIGNWSSWGKSEIDLAPGILTLRSDALLTAFAAVSAVENGRKFLGSWPWSAVRIVERSSGYGLPAQMPHLSAMTGVEGDAEHAALALVVFRQAPGVKLGDRLFVQSASGQKRSCTVVGLSTWAQGLGPARGAGARAAAVEARWRARRCQAAWAGARAARASGERGAGRGLAKAERRACRDRFEGLDRPMFHEPGSIRTNDGKK